MKKLIVCLAAVGLAVGAQAATFNWGSNAAAYGVDASAVTDNGDYAAGTTVMNKKGTWNFVLALYESGTDTLVGQTASSAVKFSTTGNKFNVTGLTIDAAAQGTTYDYVLTITGTQTDLAARGVSGSYDYSGASLTTTIRGSIETAAMGNTKLTSGVPATWSVSGIVAAGSPSGGVPEPTSGLLLLVGGALLGLRRKRA